MSEAGRKQEEKQDGGGRRVKQPNRMSIPRVAYKGTGVYTPPADAAEKEREGN